MTGNQAPDSGKPIAEDAVTCEHEWRTGFSMKTESFVLYCRNCGLRDENVTAAKVNHVNDGWDDEPKAGTPDDQ
jgi:hypothetical protein